MMARPATDLYTTGDLFNRQPRMRRSVCLDCPRLTEVSASLISAVEMSLVIAQSQGSAHWLSNRLWVDHLASVEPACRVP